LEHPYFFREFLFDQAKRKAGFILIKVFTNSMFFFACPKKNQKKAPAIEYSPIAGSSNVEQLCIVTSTLKIQN